MKLHGLFYTLLLASHTVAANTYYVATNGSDLNVGTTTNAPFLTIQKAASIMVAGDACYIRGGTYRETVSPVSSGTIGSPILFAPYTGETVIVSGADLLNLTWNVYSNSVYQANTTNAINQLFLDGNMMNIARWPNAQVNDLLNAKRATVLSATTNSLTDPNLPNIDLVGATIQVFPKWSADTRVITNYNTTTKTLYWGTNTFYTLSPNDPYYLYGKLSLLDMPTEWYQSTNGTTLYLWTPASDSPATHTIEYKARNEAFVLDNRSYITLTNLYIYGAGITMTNSINCTIDDCQLRYVQHDTTASWNSSPSTACAVSGNGSVWKNSSISFSSQDGISLGGTNAMVTNCVIRDVDYYPGNYFAAVSAKLGTGHKIVRNTLVRSGRYLVWHPTPGVEIGYNDLGFGTRLTADGGATYAGVAGGNNGGTIIHHNWCHDNIVGIYMDASQNNCFIYRNVCYNNHYGLTLNSPSYTNCAYNNTLIQNAWSISSGTPLNQLGTAIINNLCDGIVLSATNATTNTTGWFPPVGTSFLPFVPQTGSGAIDGGEVIAGYTDGYVGAAPDIGAYEVGTTYWQPGSSLFVPPFPGIAIYPPTDVSVSDGNMQTNSWSATLYWLFSDNATSYNVKRSTVSGGPYINVATGVTADYYTDTNLVPGTTYFYVITSVNSGGESWSSLEVSTYLSLTAWWKFDEGSGTTSTNSAGSGNNATLNGASWTAGQFGDAVYLNGSGIVTVSNSTVGNFGTNDFSLACYINTTNNGYIMAKRAVCGHSSFWDLLISSGEPLFEVDENTNGLHYATVSGASAVNDGRWHQLIAVRSGLNLKMYVDGLLQASFLASGIANITNSANVVMGTVPCGGKLAASIDDVRIYSRALSDAECQTLFSQQTPAGNRDFANNSSLSLAAWWKFDEGSGTTSTNSAGSGNAATLNNATWTSGEFGDAVYLNGSSIVTVSNSTVGNFGTNDFSLACYINVTNNGYIIAKRAVCGHSSFWDLLISSGMPLFEVDENTNGLHYATVSGSTVVSNGGWHQLAAVRNGVNLKMYVDGALQATYSAAGVANISNIANIVMGTTPCNGDLTGTIDDVRIYARALSDSEINALFTGENSPAQSSVVKNGSLFTYSMGGGGFILNKSLASGQSYRIQASTDLLNWVDITNIVSNGASTLHFTDSAAITIPQRFYRVVSP